MYPCREINKMAPVRLSHPMLSSPLHLVIGKQWLCTAEITYSTAHACLVPSSFVRYACMSFTWKPWLLLPLWGYTGAAPWLCSVRLCAGYVVATLWLVLWLLRQPEERLCYGCSEPGGNQRACSSHSSSRLLPASQLKPCLPWVQWTLNRISRTIPTQ